MRHISPSKDPGNFRFGHLAGGAPIYYRQCDQQFGGPKLAFSAVIVAGGRDDPPDRAGTAHFFEHMPFRGTRDYPSLRDLTHDVEANGGYINAFTSDESTGYEIVVPHNMIQEGIHRVAEMLRRPLLRQRDIGLERRVIIEELKSRQANVSFYARQTMFRELLGDHPITSAVIGTESALRRITQADLGRFHRQYYGRDNIVLFATGSFHEAQLLELCERYFGDLPSTTRPKRDLTPPIAPRQNYQRTVSPQRYNRSVYSLARVLPPVDLRARIMLEMFADMLARGANSPLNVEIRERRGLAYSVSAGLSWWKDLGVLKYSVATQYHQMAEIDRIIWGENEKVFSHAARFEEVKLMTRQAALFREYTLGSLIDTAIDNYLAMDRIVTLNEFLEIIDSITLRQLADFVRPILDRRYFFNLRVDCENRRRAKALTQNT